MHGFALSVAQALDVWLTLCKHCELEDTEQDREAFVAQLATPFPSSEVTVTCPTGDAAILRFPQMSVVNAGSEASAAWLERLQRASAELRFIVPSGVRRIGAECSKLPVGQEQAKSV